MSTFIITLEDNDKGTLIKAQEIKKDGESSGAALAMGAYMVNALNQFLSEKGFDQVSIAKNQVNHH